MYRSTQKFALIKPKLPLNVYMYFHASYDKCKYINVKLHLSNMVFDGPAAFILNDKLQHGIIKQDQNTNISFW